MIKWNSDGADSIHDFGLGMQCSFPDHREGLTEWKGEIGDGVQDFFREALCPKCSFSRNGGECAEQYVCNNQKNVYICSRINYVHEY
ncbi:hypothetical protein APS56_04750 [Pseudalgibacter alginicilyticus]|uniref:Uncharacterized protein n=1 Tax=Pseudalgibacter alginicilyticus TaxID=1736674 RepID=A0A0P0D0V5_9FLAO|nr:hypothetical protein APS56_04750 [Pseudalgibacter alginicilyticus]